MRIFTFIALPRVLAAPTDLLKAFSEDPRYEVCQANAAGPDCSKFRVDWVKRLYDSQRALIVRTVEEDGVYKKLMKDLPRINKRISALRSVVNGIADAEPGLVYIYDNIEKVRQTLPKTLLSQTANYTTALDQNFGRFQNSVQQLTAVSNTRLDELLRTFKLAVDKQVAAQAVQISDLGISSTRLLEETTRQAATVAAAYTAQVDETKTEIDNRLAEAAKIVAQLKTAVRQAQSKNLRQARQARLDVKSFQLASSEKLKALKAGVDAMASEELTNATASATGRISTRLANLDAGLKGEQAKLNTMQDEFATETSSSFSQARQSVEAINSVATQSSDMVASSLQSSLASLASRSNSSIISSQMLVADQTSQASGVLRLTDSAAVDGRTATDKMANLLKSSVAATRADASRLYGNIAGGIAKQLGTVDSQVDELSLSATQQAKNLASSSLSSFADTNSLAAAQLRNGVRSSSQAGNSLDALNQLVGTQAAKAALQAEGRTRRTAAVLDEALQQSALTLTEADAAQRVRTAESLAVVSGLAAERNVRVTEALASVDAQGALVARNAEAQRMSQAGRVARQQAQAQAAAAALGIAASSLNDGGYQLAGQAKARLVNTKQTFSTLENNFKASESAAAAAVDASQRQLTSAIDATIETAMSQERVRTAEEERVIVEQIRNAKEAKQAKNQLVHSVESNKRDALGVVVGKVDQLSDGLGSLSDSLGVEKIALDKMLSSRGTAEVASLASLQAKLNSNIKKSSESLETLTVAELKQARQASLAGNSKAYETTKESLDNMFPKFVDMIENIQSLLSELLVRGDQIELNQTKLVGMGEELLLKKQHFEEQQTQRLDSIDRNLNVWRDDIANRSISAQQNITLAMHALPQILAASLDNFTVNVKTDIQRFGRFIGRIEQAFEKQSSVERQYAVDSYVQLMAAVSGISEATLRDRVQYLTKIISAGETAKGRRLSAVQIAASLAEALRQAKSTSQSKLVEMVDLLKGKHHDFATLMNGFSVSLDAGLGYVKAEEAASTLTQYRRLYTETAQREKQIDGLGSRVASILEALDRGEEDKAKQLTESNQSVAGLAALLHAMDAETRRKLVALIRQIEAGEISFAEAVASAREVNASKIATVNDIIQAFNQIVASYVYDSKKTFGAMRQSILKFREYANFKTTDAMLQNRAMLNLLSPNVDVLEVKAGMLKNMAPDFVNKTQHDLVVLQEVSTDAIDAADATLRDVKDKFDSLVLSGKQRTQDETKAVEDKTKKEKVWINNIIAQARQAVMTKVALIQQTQAIHF